MQANVYFQNFTTKNWSDDGDLYESVTAVHMIALHLYVSNQNIFIIIRTEWMQNS